MQRGFTTTVEAGRGIITDQMAIGGKALPWADRALFAELMLSWELRSYRHAQQQDGVVVFDRGVPDVLGYLRLCGLPVPRHVSGAAEMVRYQRQVFIAPPWPETEIFHQDSERRQDLDEAERTADRPYDQRLAKPGGVCRPSVVPRSARPSSRSDSGVNA